MDGAPCLRLTSPGIRSRQAATARPRFRDARSSWRKAAFSGSAALASSANPWLMRCRSRDRPARIDQALALLPAEIDAVELIAVERETGDGQRLALGAGLFHPVVAATGDVVAVAD